MVLLYNKLDGIEVSGKSDASNWCNQLRDLMNFGGKTAIISAILGSIGHVMWSSEDIKYFGLQIW